MGLDAVEMLMDVEERFGITLRNAEFASLVRVEDLTRLVLARIAARNQVPCPCVPAFQTLRGDVRQVMGDANLRIRPRQPIVDVIPPGKRRAFWRQLKRRIEILSGLRRPLPVGAALGVLVTLLAIAGVAPILVDPAIVPLSLLAAGIVAAIAFGVTRPLCVMPPLALRTFGDITLKMAGTIAVTDNSLPPAPETWVPDVIRDIVARNLGIPREKVYPAARFGEDLNLG
jgi:hypothetical protein